MKKAKFLRKALWLLLIPFLFTACEDKMDEHYEIPEWVPANAWKVLQSGEHGNYSIFLEGAELSGYKPMLEGGALLTVMAPDDNAFQTYLEKKGYASIKDMPANELKKLIGYHLMHYSYNTENLVNFRPEGSTETDEEKEINAGLYYKHRTYSTDEPTKEIDPATNEEVLVYHQERFLPVFSYRYFQSKKIDAKTNYEYFFPHSTWNGDEGFNVSNASVKEYGVKANNGYIHVIDQVLEPLETIYTKLKQKGEYSTFLALYDTNGSYTQDPTLTNLYKNTYNVNAIYLYTHSGAGLANIACEWIESDYQSFHENAANAYTVFAPTNAAFEEFFDNYWKKGGYTSLEEVDKTALNEVYNQYICNQELGFPEEIKSGLLESVSNNVISVDFSDVKEAMMCVNGAAYGINKMQLPTFLQTVLAPIYQNKDMRSFMYAMDGSEMKKNYAFEGTNYILLIPSEKQFEAEDIYTKYLTRTLEKDTEDGLVTMNSASLANLINMHSANIVTGESNQLPVTGTRVIPTQNGGNYWFVKNGKITCNSLFNMQLNPENTETDIFTEFKLSSKEKNGTVYTFDYNGLFNAEDKDLTRSIAICADQREVYHHFSQLLKKAGLIINETLIPAFRFQDGIGTKARYIAFIPTNKAIENALAANLIPGATNASFDNDGNLEGTFDSTVLSNYLRTYFLTLSTNSLNDYPYIGSSMQSGKYITQQIETEGENKPMLIYTNTGNSLSVQLEGGKKCNVIPDYDYFPFANTDGCFHLIDDTF